MKKFNLGDINLFFEHGSGRWSILHPSRRAFYIKDAMARIYMDGKWHTLFEKAINLNQFRNKVIITEKKYGITFKLYFTCPEKKIPGVILRLEIVNNSGKDVVLGPAHILDIDRGLPVKPDDTKVFVDSGSSWWAGVVDITDTSPYKEQWEILPPEDRQLAEKIKGKDVDKGFHNSGGGISVLYDSKSGDSLILSFATFYRTISNITWIYKEKEGLLYGWAGCDFAGFKLKKGKKVFSEYLFLGFYQSPFSALEGYAELSVKYMKVKLPRNVPLGWCSWYAYRLDVSEKNVLKNAEMIKKHFPYYNFKYIQVDHGWQYKNICGHWTETNERFPHGIKWLSKQIQKMGFELGLWMALFTVLESSPLFRKHPECLIKNLEGMPRPMPFLWSWPPYDRVYCLDPTHPGSKKFIKETLNYLRRSGVRYWKIDFTWRIAIRDKDALYYDQRYIKGADIYRKGLSL
ncbi:MAG: alpha-galactosidase, partial [Candidatus Omnitrophica bacterium]|nr:alpha-galactosidase [Candidatus Omnitrophota bacterium]